jgi:hypothetical protein
MKCTTWSLLADAALDGNTSRRADYDHFFSFHHHSPPSSELSLNV